MVRGKPVKLEDARLVLDDIVKKSVLFLREHKDSLRDSQPEGYRVKKDYDKELTNALREADLLSDDYVAVASGNFESGHYAVCVYDSKLSADVPQFKNVALSIKGKVDDDTVTYDLVGSIVHFEEAKGNFELMINDRKVDLSETKSTSLNVQGVKHGFNNILSLSGNTPYSGDAEQVMLIWHASQVTPAECYRQAHFSGKKVDLGVCEDPNIQLKQLGPDKALIYHFH